MTAEDLRSDETKAVDASRAAAVYRAIVAERKRCAAEIAELRAALKPLAEIGLWIDQYPNAHHDRIDGRDLCITAAQVRAARAALGGEQKAVDSEQ
jgi:hypothetical protein